MDPIRPRAAVTSAQARARYGWVFPGPAQRSVTTIGLVRMPGPAPPGTPIVTDRLVVVVAASSASARAASARVALVRAPVVGAPVVGAPDAGGASRIMPNPSAVALAAAVNLLMRSPIAGVVARPASAR
jgi:hypothetical protein